MTTWHRAKIKFQYSPKIDLNHRSITSVTTQFNSNTNCVAMKTLLYVFKHAIEKICGVINARY